MNGTFWTRALHRFLDAQAPHSCHYALAPRRGVVAAMDQVREVDTTRRASETGMGAILKADRAVAAYSSSAAEAEVEEGLEVDWNDPRKPSHAWRVGARRVRYRWQGHRLD